MRVIGRAAVLLMLASALPLVAQELKCERNETAPQCASRIAPAVVGDTPEAAEKKTEDATATAATGITNVTSASESSLKDFLTLFAASMESATTSEDGDAFTFDWNPKLAFAPNLGAKLQAAFPKTKLNDEVTKRMAATTDKLDKLKESLEFGDDAILSGFLEPESATHGRSVSSQRDWFRPMRNAMVAPRTNEDKELADLLESHEMLQNQRFENDSNGKKLENEDEIQSRLSDFTDLFLRRKEARATRSEFFMAFAKLLNNQPQFYGAVSYHPRRNVIGPNEWSGKVTYEYGSNNLNSFRKKNEACDGEHLSASNAAECAESLTKFAGETRTGIERISLSVEYHKQNRRWIDDTDNGLAFGFPATRSFVGSLAFGTNMAPMLPLRNEKTGVGDARLDLTAKYELPEDNDKDTKGFVGTLTYTQKISAAFSLPISLVYSDHESDLLNVQKRFSTKFGLMYKLPDL